MGQKGITSVLVVFFFVLPLPGRAESEGRKSILVLPFELVDTSLQGELEGPSEQDRKRLEAVTRRVRALLRHSPRYQLVESNRAEALFEQYRAHYKHVHKCKGCSLEAAREVGADWVLVGWIQKVSNLILNMTIRVQDRHTDKVVAGGWISFRGNTEAMWRRAVDNLITSKLLEVACPETQPLNREGQ